MTQVGEPRTETGVGLDRVHHWIDGARVAGTSGRFGPVYDPALGAIARTVDFASVEEVDAAVASAAAAFPAWRATSLSSAPRSCSGSATSWRRTGLRWRRT